MWFFHSTKCIPNFNAHSYACSLMPKESLSNKDIKLSYINGHYCYSKKVAFITNGLYIIRHIDFYNSDTSNNIADAKLGAEHHKDSYDSKSLIPVLNNFFNYHPDFKITFFIVQHVSLYILVQIKCVQEQPYTLICRHCLPQLLCIYRFGINDILQPLEYAEQLLLVNIMIILRFYYCHLIYK